MSTYYLGDEKAEVREVETFAQGHIARKRTAKIPTASSGSGHFVCLKASSSLPLLHQEGAALKLLALNLGSLINYFDHKTEVKMMLCDFQG